jgi:hypothetical protein
LEHLQRTRKVKGLSAAGKLARQHDSCWKIVSKKQVLFTEHPVYFVSSWHYVGYSVGSSGGDASSGTVVESIFEMHTKALGS